jgi:hypothetical protein
MGLRAEGWQWRTVPFFARFLLSGRVVVDSGVYVVLAEDDTTDSGDCSHFWAEKLCLVVNEPIFHAGF